MTGDETLRRAEEAELAARRARQDAGDEIVSPLADADERAIETALRPKRLTEFVGQRGDYLVPRVLAGPARGELGFLGPAEGLVTGHRATAC